MQSREPGRLNYYMLKSWLKSLGGKKTGTGDSSEAAATPVEIKAPAGERVCDKYPEVTKLAINLSLRAPFENTEPTVRGFSLGPDAMANFVFRCKNTECHQGGFDLTEEIEKMIAAYETNGHGRRVCQGWDGKSNIGHQRCYWELNFVVNISYS